MNNKELKKQYVDNEDNNRHTENMLLLAKNFGTKSEVKKVESYLKKRNTVGSLSLSDTNWLYKNIHVKYYKKLTESNKELKKQYVDNEELMERVLNIAQRRAIGRRMKRHAKKNARIRLRKSKRLADKDTIEKRSRKEAIKVIRKIVGGANGENYNSLGTSQKIQIDKKVEKKKALVDRIAKRLVKKVRKKEIERFKNLKNKKDK